MQVNAAPPDFS